MKSAISRHSFLTVDARNCKTYLHGVVSPEKSYAVQKDRKMGRQG